MNNKTVKWIAARIKYKLSDKHIQMARELGLNPDKLGKIDNHEREPWKAPLPEFIESLYFKHFKREQPLIVKSFEQSIKDFKEKKDEKKKKKAELEYLE